MRLERVGEIMDVDDNMLDARRAIDAKDLVEFCSRRIPRYMVPDTFTFTDRLAKTSTVPTTWPIPAASIRSRL